MHHGKLKKIQLREATNGWLHSWTHPTLRCATQRWEGHSTFEREMWAVYNNSLLNLYHRILYYPTSEGNIILVYLWQRVFIVCDNDPLFQTIWINFISFLKQFYFHQTWYRIIDKLYWNNNNNDNNIPWLSSYTKEG